MFTQQSFLNLYVALFRWFYQTFLRIFVLFSRFVSFFLRRNENKGFDNLNAKMFAKAEK